MGVDKQGLCDGTNISRVALPDSGVSGGPHGRGYLERGLLAAAFQVHYAVPLAL